MELRIALAGNPNSGKTTLFNALTGSNQFVGNWPGVTVEKKEGKLKKHSEVVITDLPGIYSLSPYTLEEVVDGTFTFSTEMELENSVLGMIGKALCWIFAPLGFGSIKATVAAIMGLVAKEEVVGVFGVPDFEGMTRLAAYSFLVFNLLCAPCFAAIGAIRREMNSAKWTWFAIGYQCAFAYAISLMIYQFGSAFTGNLNVIGLMAAAAVLAVMVYMLFIKRCQEATKLSKCVKVTKEKTKNRR